MYHGVLCWWGILIVTMITNIVNNKSELNNIYMPNMKPRRFFLKVYTDQRWPVQTRSVPTLTDPSRRCIHTETNYDSWYHTDLQFRYNKQNIHWWVGRYIPAFGLYIFFKCLFFFKMLKFSQTLKKKIMQKLAVSV